MCQQKNTGNGSETMPSDGNKGSTPRPFSVDKKTFDDNWDKIFKNEYQDELSTEDCVLSALNKEVKEQPKRG